MRRGKLAAILFLLGACAWAQPADVTGNIDKKFGFSTIAVPDFRGAGGAEKFVKDFNATLWTTLSGSGALKMVEKNFYPLNAPQQPSDFRPGAASLTDWSHPPVSATHLAFGYAAVQNNQLVVRGWLDVLSQPDPASAQILSKLYIEALNSDGAKKAARDFAANILSQFSMKSLAGTSIYFASDRSGAQRDMVDGLRRIEPAQDHQSPRRCQSARGFRATANLAYTTVATHAADKTKAGTLWSSRPYPAKRLRFENPPAPTNSSPEFAPDGSISCFRLDAYRLGRDLTSPTWTGPSRRRISKINAISTCPRASILKPEPMCCSSPTVPASSSSGV